MAFTGRQVICKGHHRLQMTFEASQTVVCEAFLLRLAHETPQTGGFCARLIPHFLTGKRRVRRTCLFPHFFDLSIRVFPRGPKKCNKSVTDKKQLFGSISKCPKAVRSFTPCKAQQGS